MRDPAATVMMLSKKNRGKDMHLPKDISRLIAEKLLVEKQIISALSTNPIEAFNIAVCENFPLYVKELITVVSPLLNKEFSLMTKRYIEQYSDSLLKQGYTDIQVERMYFDMYQKYTLDPVHYDGENRAQLDKAFICAMTTGNWEIIKLMIPEVKKNTFWTDNAYIYAHWALKLDYPDVLEYILKGPYSWTITESGKDYFNIYWDWAISKGYKRIIDALDAIRSDLP